MSAPLAVLLLLSSAGTQLAAVPATGSGSSSSIPELTVAAIARGCPAHDPGECWCEGYHPYVCCPVEDRDSPYPGCFCRPEMQDCAVMEQAGLTQDRCCSAVYLQGNRSVDFAAEGNAEEPELPRRAPEADGLKVDVWCATSLAYKDVLLVMLQSMQHFWPLERWRSEAIVVLEADKPGSRELCLQLLSTWTFVRCIPEFPPPKWEPDELGSSYMWSRGLTRGMWQSFWADKHSDADWIAVVDPDVVFFTPYLPDLLFDWSGREPRPVVFGDHVPAFILPVVSLGMAWVSEFMTNFPMVVRPRHLASLRDHFMNVTRKSTFNDAFQATMQTTTMNIKKYAWWVKTRIPTGDEPMCFSAILGHYLYHFHREEFFWSLLNGLMAGAAPEHTCPSLRYARHFGGNRNQKAEDLPKLGSRAGVIAYWATAMGLMQGGEEGLSATPRTEPQRLLLDALTIGDWGTWPSNVPSYCKRRNLDALLRTYREWDAARFAAAKVEVKK